MPFVVWTMNDGLAAIQGSGGSQGHPSCSAIPLKDVVTTGAGWATTSGPATAALAEESATGRIDDGASRSVVGRAWAGAVLSWRPRGGGAPGATPPGGAADGRPRGGRTRRR